MVDSIWTDLLRAESRRPARPIDQRSRIGGEASGHSGPRQEFALKGEITARSASAFAVALKDMITGGVDSIVLDVGRVDFIDGEVMRGLALIASDLEQRGGRLRVRTSRDVTRRSFEMLGLGRLLVHDD